MTDGSLFQENYLRSDGNRADNVFMISGIEPN
jgi:hypothetical protein